MKISRKIWFSLLALFALVPVMAAPAYAQQTKFKARFGPRGVLKCWASDKNDTTVDPAFGKVGKQVIENTGALNGKRMETVNEEFLAAAKDFGLLAAVMPERCARRIWLGWLWVVPASAMLGCVYLTLAWFSLSP